MDLNLEKKIERKLKKINSRKLILKETVKMYKNIKKQKLLIKRNIVNILSYDAFRLIFDYLDYETVYSIIRKVCKRLKMYVDSYIQPSEIFLSSAGREIPNQIHYYFDCPAKQKILVRENLARPSVNQSSKPMKYMIGNTVSGAVYKDKIELVVGNFSKSLQQHFIKEQLAKNIILAPSGYFQKSFTYITFAPFKFDAIENEWNLADQDYLADIRNGCPQFCIQISGTGFVICTSIESASCDQDKSRASKFISKLLFLRAFVNENSRGETAQALKGKKVFLYTKNGKFEAIPQEPKRLFIRIK